MAGKRFKPAFKRLALVVLALLLTSGCGSFGKMWENLFGKKGSEIEVLPQELAYQGMEQLKAGRYTTAVDTFQTLKDRYPYSKYAILAELKIADALFLKEEYQNAHDAYVEFEQLHPKNEAVPYVIYQQGMCFFKQMTGFDREQVPTVLAIQTFTRLVQTYPDSRYSAMAIARITEAQNSLAHHEFYVGEFYYKMKAYKAAKGRFVSLVKNYPDTGFHGRALEYIKKCRQKMAQIEEKERLKEEKRLKAEAKEEIIEPAEPEPIETKEETFETERPAKNEADAETVETVETADDEAGAETAETGETMDDEADAETAETGETVDDEADAETAETDSEPTGKPQEAGSTEEADTVEPLPSKETPKKASTKMEAPTPRGESGVKKPKRKPIQLIPPQPE